MTESANTLHRHQLPRHRAAVPQRVVSGDSGAEQRSRVGVAQTLRDRRQCLNGRQHVLLVTSVIADARNLQIPAIAKVPPPARGARVVLAAVPTDADPLPLLPLGNTGACLIDDAGHFVSRNTGILNAGP